VFISGDLNSRTSILPDYVDFDKYLDTNLPCVCCYDIPNRINSDKTIDAQCKRMLDLCISTGLLIANGRLHADKSANEFTFCSHRRLLKIVETIRLHLSRREMSIRILKRPNPDQILQKLERNIIKQSVLHDKNTD